MFSSVHQSIAPNICEANPLASASLQQRHGEVQGLQKHFGRVHKAQSQGSTSPMVPVSPTTGSLNRDKAAYAKLHGSGMGGLVKSLTVS